MNFWQAINSGFTNYSNFNGRSSRSEYWNWTLFNVLVRILLIVLMVLNGENTDNVGAITVIYAIFNIAVLLPSLAVSARRLHDVGKSGWNYLWVVTIIGWIPYLIWTTRAGNSAPNKWGKSPLSSHPTGLSSIDSLSSVPRPQTASLGEYRLFGFDENGYVIKASLKIGDPKLASPGVTIGRDTHCGIIIVNDSLSRQHAQFFSSGGSIWIRDLNSTNGTRVNDVDIGAGGSRRLNDGDALLLGTLELSITEA